MGLKDTVGKMLGGVLGDMNDDGGDDAELDDFVKSIGDLGGEGIKQDLGFKIGLIRGGHCFSRSGKSTKIFIRIQISPMPWVWEE